MLAKLLIQSTEPVQTIAASQDLVTNNASGFKLFRTIAND